MSFNMQMFKEITTAKVKVMNLRLSPSSSEPPAIRTPDGPVGPGCVWGRLG